MIRITDMRSSHGQRIDTSCSMMTSVRILSRTSLMRYETKITLK